MRSAVTAGRVAKDGEEQEGGDDRPPSDAIRHDVCERLGGQHREREDAPALRHRQAEAAEPRPVDQGQHEGGYRRERESAHDTAAHRRKRRVDASLKDAEEADDRRDQHQVEDLHPVGIMLRQRVVSMSRTAGSVIAILSSTRATDTPAELATYRVGLLEARSRAAYTCCRSTARSAAAVDG